MERAESDDRAGFLASSALRAGLLRFVRGRAPISEADDIVQATLADALCSNNAPPEISELRRWVYGIARNKVADYYRRNRREEPQEPAEADEVAAAESAPLSARELLHWAEKELPEGDTAQNTLEWMLREGSGEKLEEIASEQQLPAPRVRQRVARMRRHFRERWAAHLAALAMVAFLIGSAYVIWRRAGPMPPEPIAHEPPLERTSEERADELRRTALEDCAKAAWQPCLAGLDQAKALDPRGDHAEPIQSAREAASRALAPAATAEPTSGSLEGPKTLVPPKSRVTTPKRAAPKAAPTPPMPQQNQQRVMPPTPSKGSTESEYHDRGKK